MTWLFFVTVLLGGALSNWPAKKKKPGPISVVSGVTIFGVSERANRLEQSKV